MNIFVGGARVGAECMVHSHFNPVVDLGFGEVGFCSKEETVLVLYIVHKVKEGLVFFLSHLIELDLDIILPSRRHEVHLFNNQGIVEEIGFLGHHGLPRPKLPTDNL